MTLFSIERGLLLLLVFFDLRYPVTITHSLEHPDSPLSHWVSATAKRADSADMEVVVTVRVSEERSCTSLNLHFNFHIDWW
jgi:hypothetical protein